ncbi:MAG: hypothetical protein ACE37D_02250 [Pseudomonadales bacterium]
MATTGDLLRHTSTFMPQKESSAPELCTVLTHTFIWHMLKGISQEMINETDPN